MNSIINREHISYLNIMAEELETEHLSIFAGAGISINSGFVDWKGLMRPIIEQLEINPNIDLALAAQFFENEYGRHDINKLIFDEFNRIPKNNEILMLLGQLPIKSYWTTNYDSLIEDTLSNPPIQKIVDLKVNKDQFKYHVPNHDVTIYKMHGDKRYPDEAIITKNDYETYDRNREVFTKALFTELITNTFLFIGFSFSDPNLERILSIVKHTFDNNAPKNHYCFMRKVQEKDYSDNKQYNEDSNYQKLRIREMRRYGIQTILIDDFSQILTCLKYIKKKLDQRRVFISGSITDSVSKDSDEAELIQFLARKLAENNFRIVSGFGQNIGNYLLIGACYGMNLNISKKLNNTIEIYPLVSVGDNTQELREQLISNSGCIITLFGKETYAEDNLKKLNEDGVYQEYRIAKDKGITLLPVGCTGKTSKWIWEDANKQQVYQGTDLESSWQGLNNYDIKEKENIVNCIMELIEYKNIQEQKQLEKDLLMSINNISKIEKPLQKVFLSFHYNSSHKIAEKYRQLINKTGKYIATEEEVVRDRTNQTEIYNWIDKKINGTVATVLIYDKSIFESKYVDYEIKASLERQNIIIVISVEDCIAKTEKKLRKKYPLLESSKVFYKADSEIKMEDILCILNENVLPSE